MTHPCRPVTCSATVLANTPLAERTWKVDIDAPELALRTRPGQFIMVRLPGQTDPLLGRPFALCDTLPGGRGISFVHLVVGKATGMLARLRPGDPLEAWGPLGQRFPEPADGARRVALVAGGIGQTPFLAHTRELLGTMGFAGDRARRRVDAVDLVYGARTASLHAGVDAFREAGATVHLATDDGSAGTRGRVTDVLAALPRPDHVFGCGPEPMLKALARQCATLGLPCHLSLETPMACGLGICYSCVVKVRDPGSPAGWDYRRVCVDGPTFAAGDLVDFG
ncbi:MAG: dihydroorotate dehydrogenase electron transfer subunit [Planctomycetes bacterium]|nr:dihydroorotate dehydrogenase electron transfer subunit [Planctomycetota bacterium]